MGFVMKTRYILSALGIAMLAIPAAAPASQPDVRFADLQQGELPTPAPLDLGMLLMDPHQTGEFSIVLPRGFTTLGAELGSFGG